MALGAFVAGFSALNGIMSGNRATNSANKLSDRALALQEEQLQFAKDRYQRWQTIYGPIEDNLSDFFYQLTPEKFAAQGLESFQKQFQQSQTDLTEFFAVNGIESGVQADLMTKSGNEAARSKAKIVQQAPFEVAAAQQSFLSIGMQKEAGAASGVSNAAANTSNLLSQQANIAADSAAAGFDAANIGLQAVADSYDKTVRDRENASSGSSRISGVVN